MSYGAKLACNYSNNIGFNPQIYKRDYQHQILVGSEEACVRCKLLKACKEEMNQNGPTLIMTMLSDAFFFFSNTTTN